MERLVCSSGLRYPAFRLVKEGARLSPADYTTDLPWRPVAFTAVADVDRLLAEFEAGATIVLQALHYHWPPLAEFCRRLEAQLGHPVQANAYFTPRDSQGLAVHHDTHDVFVLQVDGSKRWLVYEPALELPLRDQRYSEELGLPEAPTHDVVLGAGDTLYLPRGWLHQALTSDTDSLHVTIGINVHTWLDAFKAALEECAHELEFRRSVRAGEEAAAGLLELLASRLGAADIQRRSRERFVASRRPLRGGQLTQLRALDHLGLDTLLERRPTVVEHVQAGDESVTLAFEGKKVTFPPQARAELEYVVGAKGAFRSSDLPGLLDESGKLMLVRRLVREGFLTISDGHRPAARSR